jgi:hypothetical protein
MSRLSFGTRPLLIAIALVASPSVAAAAGTGLGNSRSESFDIDITIPPFAAGIAAAAEGAVGLSSLDTPGGGLLVKSPDVVAAGSQGQISVFSRTGAPVTAFVKSGRSHASITAGQTSPFKGMDRTTFVVAPTGGQSGASTVSVVVGAV